MIDVETNLNTFNHGELAKLFFFFHNKSDQHLLVFQFELLIPKSILHVGGAKKSINVISIEKNQPHKHAIEIVSYELGTYYIGIKIRCLNQTHLSREMQIPIVVMASVGTQLEEYQATKNTQNNINEDKSPNMILSELLLLIRSSFNLSELKTLCLELSVDYEDIPGDNKTDKIEELILYFKRRGRLSDLVNCCRSSRPNLAWPPK